MSEMVHTSLINKSRLHWIWLLFAALIAGYSVVMLLIPTSEKVARARIEAMHIATPQWKRWAAWQLLPSMYNFSNYAACRTKENLAEPVSELSRLNHYPAQFLTFTFRHRFVTEKGQRYLRLESHYRGRAYRTDYTVWTLPGKDVSFKTMTVVKKLNPFSEIEKTTPLGQFHHPLQEVIDE